MKNPICQSAIINDGINLRGPFVTCSIRKNSMRTKNSTLVTWYFPEFLSTTAQGQLHAKNFALQDEHLQVAMDANKCLLVSMSFTIVPLSLLIPLDILLFQTVDLPSPAQICCPKRWKAIVYRQIVHQQSHNVPAQ